MWFGSPIVERLTGRIYCKSMIYLDYNATSPIHPDVRASMSRVLDGNYGNPSSLHAAGREAREAVEQARRTCLSAIGDPAGQLIFTSGGTEADNLAVKGLARALKQKGNHLIVSSVEHHAVLQPAEALREEGFRVTEVGVDRHGVLKLEDLRNAVTPETVLVSVMHANNEVGTIQPIAEAAAIARAQGALFHSDAVQSFGKVSLPASSDRPDALSLSAHKLGGPKGVGALYLRKGVKIAPTQQGGPHERNLRAGTEGVPGIVGMEAAVRLSVREEKEKVPARVLALREMLEKGLLEKVPDAVVNGHPTQRLPGTLNLSFRGCTGETLLIALDLEGICVSTGAACSSGSTEPSHVLTAMRLPADQVEGSIRFSLGRGTTREEIQRCLQIIPRVVERVRRA